MRGREKNLPLPSAEEVSLSRSWRQSYNVLITIALPSARVNVKILVPCTLNLRNNTLHFHSGKKLFRIMSPENNNSWWLLMPNFQKNLPTRCSQICKKGQIITSPETPKKISYPYTENCCRAKQMSWKSRQTGAFVSTLVLLYSSIQHLP